MKAATPSPCSPAEVLLCRPVEGPAELAAHHRVRRQVFVVEQGLFVRDDSDAVDAQPATVHVLGLVAGVPAGTVRLYPYDPGDATGSRWRGDRLAVLREHRRSGLGGPLVRLAVATAGRLGGVRMDATVQAVNTAFFLELGWSIDGDVVQHLGVPHQPMRIGL